METIEINGVEFTPIEGLKYPYDYVAIARDVAGDPDLEFRTYRTLLQEDRFFMLHFCMKVPGSNHPFVVEGCREVMEQKGNQMFKLWLWAREHYKSSTITTADTLCDVCENPNEKIAIFSFTKAAAMKFTTDLKDIMERNEFLRHHFPDVFWMEGETPNREWTKEALVVKRSGHGKEATIQAHGLIDGMPTGAHFTKMKFDDIETLDLVQNPDQMQKCKDAFDMAMYLGSDAKEEGGVDCEVDVIGTFYHHLGPLKHIEDKVDPLDGEHLFYVSKRPGTKNGDPNGESLLLSEKRMRFFRSNPLQFHTQILMDPTPKGEGALNSDNLIFVPYKSIPKNLRRFLIVDSAGSEQTLRGDAWAILLIGIHPFIDSIGASDVFVLDMVLKSMDHGEAIQTIVDMYMRGGRIEQVGVEKVGISTTEIHVAGALRSNGKLISVENGNLRILRPEGRKKAIRIESALQWPMLNGKIKLNNSIPEQYVNRLIQEFDRFPVWHDDGLDGLSYVYDILRDYDFTKFPPQDTFRDAYDEEDDDETPESWMVQ